MSVSIIYCSETGNAVKTAELVANRCRRISGIEANRMSGDKVDTNFLEQSKVVIFSSPTLDGNLSWQLSNLSETPVG